jgi:hypothetical protein
VQLNGLNELTGPGDFLLLFNLSQKLGVHLLLLFLLSIGDDVDNLHVLLGESGTLRGYRLQDNTKRFISLNVFILRYDLDPNHATHFLGLECNCTLIRLVVLPRGCRQGRRVDLLGLVIDGDNAIRTVFPDEFDLSIFLV